MYETCPEAHSHWLASKEAEAKIAERDRPGFEFYRRTADAELNSAATSWKAHAMGVCSSAVRAIVEKQRRTKR